MEPRPSETRQTPRPSDRPVGTPRPSSNPVSSPTSILLLITSPSQHDRCGFGRWSYETCSCSCDVDRFPISEGTCAPCVLLENAPPPSPSSLSIQPTVGDFVIAIVRWSNSMYCLNGAITLVSPKATPRKKNATSLNIQTHLPVATGIQGMSIGIQTGMITQTAA